MKQRRHREFKKGNLWKKVTHNYNSMRACVAEKPKM